MPIADYPGREGSGVSSSWRITYHLLYADSTMAAENLGILNMKDLTERMQDKGLEVKRSPRRCMEEYCPAYAGWCEVLLGLFLESTGRE
jgi:hypothetical protein